MRQFLIFLLSANILACGSNNNPAVIGTWKTHACEQEEHKNTSLSETWSKGIYEFTSSGAIVFNSETYNDAECSIKADEQKTKNYWPSATFEDSGKETLAEGISGYAIEISMGTLPGKTEIPGFYSLLEGKLCFSRTFQFDPNFDINIIVLPEGEGDPIDFENCLSK